MIVKPPLFELKADSAFALAQDSAASYESVKNSNAERSDGNVFEGHSMKAIVRARYGPPEVLQFTEAEKPTPAANQVLIKLYAASVNPLDLFQLRGMPLVRAIPGMRTPKQRILGCDIAGRVEAVGSQVKQFHPGDAVFGVTGFAGGGFAEYVCAPEDKLALKPANLSFEEAATAPIAAITAL